MFEQISHRGLAETVASVILATPHKYEPDLPRITCIRPEYTQAILERIRGDESVKLHRWSFGLSVCEATLQDNEVRSVGTWTATRRTIAGFLEFGLNYEEFELTNEHLLRIRDLLLILLNDPDPNELTDQPPEGHSGYQDPTSVSLYAVRARALSNLIIWAEKKAEFDQDCLRASLDKYMDSVQSFDPIVEEALTEKLDRNEDPSHAVHSVYGHHLFRLFELDSGWVERHIDEILPEEDTETAIGYYIASWDSYITYHWYWHPDLEFLRPKYERAIYNLSQGSVTKSIGPADPVSGLAAHIADEYLRIGYDFHSTSGSENLLRLLYEEGTPSAWGGVAWLFWRVLDDNPENRKTQWPKIRLIWEWRAEQAALKNYPSEFADEMKYFAFMIPAIPEGESMNSILPLLRSLIPYITQSKYRCPEWDAVEKYLASEVDQNPVKVIHLYLEMFTRKPPLVYNQKSPERRRIIETAAADTRARNDAIRLIHLLGQQGNYEFQDIYERYENQFTYRSEPE
jgi:hypothetical protein